MAMQKVEFQFITGLKGAIFRNLRLRGSWDSNGRYSDDWTESPMQEVVGEDQCPIFKASISLDLTDQGRTFKWGVALTDRRAAISGAFPPKYRMSIPLSAI